MSSTKARRATERAPDLLQRGGLALLGAFLLVGCSGERSTAQEAAVVPSDRSVVRQRADAARAVGDTARPLTVVEISDFQCPFCARFYRDTYAALDSLYVETGKARWVFVNFAAPGHARAWPAAEAAACAGAVGKFWPMHDLLFENQQEWAESEDPMALFVDYARRVGVDGESFRSCLEEDLPSQMLISDLQQVASARIQSTPFFIVNGQTAIAGAQPLSRFQTVLDSVLRAQGQGGGSVD